MDKKVAIVGYVNTEEILARRLAIEEYRKIVSVPIFLTLNIFRNRQIALPPKKIKGS